jgi:hypothetical protein
MNNMPALPETYNAIQAGIIELLQTARETAAPSVNSLTTAVYGEIGRRIVEYEQRGEARADYAEQLVEQLATTFRANSDAGLEKQIFGKCGRSIERGPEQKIFQTLSGEFATPIISSDIGASSSSIFNLSERFPLPWSAYVRLLAVKNPDARTFYETEALHSGSGSRRAKRASETDA